MCLLCVFSCLSLFLLKKKNGSFLAYFVVFLKSINEKLCAVHGMEFCYMSIPYSIHSAKQNLVLGFAKI